MQQTMISVLLHGPRKSGVKYLDSFETTSYFTVVKYVEARRNLSFVSSAELTTTTLRELLEYEIIFISNQITLRTISVSRNDKL